MKRNVAYAVAAILALSFATYEWWPMMVRGGAAQTSGGESWVSVATHAAGYEYHVYRIVLRGGRTVHAEGTHYVWTKGGDGLVVKNAGTGDLVFVAEDSQVLTVERER